MPKLKDSITIRVDGEDREIFMSYGLVNLLAGVAGDPDAAGRFVIDQDMREQVMRILLSERNKAGKLTGEPLENIEDVELSIADARRLLAWASEHTIDFFLDSVLDMKETIQKAGMKMDQVFEGLDLPSSTTGSESSTPKS